jgi:hypothetical protein
MTSQIVLDARDLIPASSLAVVKGSKEETGFIVDKDDGADLDIGDTQPIQSMEE